VFDGHFTVWYSEDEPTRGLAGVIDITARKQAFLALEKSEQRYRLLFHNLPAALWQIDSQPSIGMFKDLRSEGVTDLSAYMDEHPDFLPAVIGAQKIEEANDYAVRLFGARDRDELIGTSPWTWIKSRDVLRRALESRWVPPMRCSSAPGHRACRSRSWARLI
jgi:PAS domain-containing protein